MKTSIDGILTTHTGSLPRSKALSSLLVKREQRKPYDDAALRQRSSIISMPTCGGRPPSGITVGNDGETPRVGFSTYTTERMSGFGGESLRKPTLDADQVPRLRRLHETADRRFGRPRQGLERAAGDGQAATTIRT